MEIPLNLWIGLFSLLFVLVFVLLVLVIALMRKYRKFMKGLSNINAEELMQTYADALNKLNLYIQNELEPRIEKLEAKAPDAVRCVGMVPYNAFDNMGSQMSYSVALLSDKQTGVVLTGIYGRDSSYTYAKKLESGVPNKELSREEKEAVRIALVNGKIL